MNQNMKIRVIITCISLLSVLKSQGKYLYIYMLCDSILMSPQHNKGNNSTMIKRWLQACNTRINHGEDLYRLVPAIQSILFIYE